MKSVFDLNGAWNFKRNGIETKIKARAEDPVRYIDKASDFKQHYYPG